MLEKIEQQQKDITDKAQVMGALKEQMDKKEKLFEEVERCRKQQRNLGYKKPSW